MRKTSAGEGLARVQAEIAKEKAEALGRAGARIAETIRALHLLRDEVGALEAGRASPADVPDAVQAAAQRRAEYAALRRTAQRYSQYLIIQREAMGFRKHGDVEWLYPLPGPLPAPWMETGEKP